MSLFSNSNANRRIKRGGPKRSQSLLEVTARPDKERRVLIRKRVGICLKGILTAAFVSVVVFGGRSAVQRLIWENPSYAISDIRFSTDGMLTRVQVLEALELWEGRNIFSVDIGKLRSVLDALPQVDRAEVRRTLPDRLDIRLVERQPVAWVAASATAELVPGGNAYLVDARGYVMRTRKVLPEHLTLPLITGVHMEDVAPGQRLPSAESIAAIELLRLNADDLRWQPRVVDVSKGYCLVVTDQKKARVTFGFDALEEQLNRLRQLMDTVEPMQRELQTVNLMLERNVPVTFAPAPPPVVPEIKTKGGKPAPKTPPSILSSAVTADQIAKAQAASMSTPTTAPVPAASPLVRLMAKSEPAPVAPVPTQPREIQKESAQESVREVAPKPKAVKLSEPKMAKVPEPNPEPAPPKPRKKVEAPVEAAPPRAVPVEKHGPASKPNPPAPAPGTLTPNEGLRKLFNPHG
jgi:cell division septal protein FtsQ